jgi:hypothetical protein
MSPVRLAPLALIAFAACGAAEDPELGETIINFRSRR